MAAARAAATRPSDAGNPPQALAPSPSSRLDQIDFSILQTLQTHGRMSLLDLARALGISRHTASERVASLMSRQYILQFAAVLNHSKVRPGFAVFTRVRLDRSHADRSTAFRAAVLACSEILECHSVAGKFDYLLKIFAPDMRDHLRVLASIVWSLPGVCEAHTFAVVEEVKRTTQLALSKSVIDIDA
jgi:Lrp/AsnC family leucine-responsive transcriptional regulator